MATATQYMTGAQLSQAATFSNATIANSGHNWLPDFTANPSSSIAHDYTSRATKKAGDGSSSNLSIHYGTCQAHWGKNEVYSKLSTDGRIPSAITSTTQVIFATSINELKDLLNVLITGWVKDGGTYTFDLKQNGNVFGGNNNEHLTTTSISTKASAHDVIRATVWNDILNRLTIFDTVADIAEESIQASTSIDTPSITTQITRTNYNNLIKSIELIAKACKCNSDCACNMVCVCNADCGCNY